MSDGPVPAIKQPTDRPDIDDGRYLYCLVEPDGDADLDVEGIDGASVYTIDIGDVGAIVHRCDQLYDDTSMDLLRRRLLTHHYVVDHASERFGTPIPLQFHTIVDGDDAAVTAWLRDRHQQVADILADLDGYWEYRIRIDWNDDALEDQVTKSTDRLAELDRRIEQAGAGKTHLLKKEYDRICRRRVEDRKNTTLSNLADDLSPLAQKIEHSDTAVSSSIAAENDADSQSQLVVLASQNRASDIGDHLERFREIADIQFTGPWAPYSFVPELGE